MKIIKSVLTIHITYDHPPIPIRDFDWSAIFDGYEPGGLYGQGKTKLEAVMNLLEQYDEQSEQEEI